VRTLVGAGALGLVALAACTPPATPPSAAAPPASAPAARLAVPSSAASVELRPPEPPPRQSTARGCARIQRAQQEAFEEARKPDPKYPLDADDLASLALIDSLPEELGRCYGAAETGWGIVVGGLSPAPQTYPPVGGEVTHALLGSLKVLFVDGDQLLEVPLASSGNAFSGLRLDPVVYDWKHDGRTQLGVCWEGTFHLPLSGVILEDRKCEVFRVQAGKIETVTPHDVRRFADVDRDGAPDLVSYDPFWIPGRSYSTEACSMCIDDDVHGPELVSHARSDGTFSRTDAVAVAYARRQCPTKPAILFPVGCGASEFARGFQQFACAVLWGEKKSALESAAKLARQRCCPDPSYCPEVERLDEWAAQPPLSPILR
jgi:hypothetical protein